MPFRTLISAAELATCLNGPNVVIFDCRHDLAKSDAGEQSYRLAHIPNAQFLHLDRDLSGKKTGKNGRHPLPSPERLAERLSRLGVSNDAQVVAYDDSGGMFAARLWWLLRWLGHDEVAVLDGGLSAWQRAGLPTTARVSDATPRRMDWQRHPMSVDVDHVLQHLNTPEMLIIDARAPDRFRGENESIDPVGGHIPGAINRFFKDNLRTDGCFKPAAQLRAEFDAILRGHAPATVVNQCGSGITACHNLLALEIAGFTGATLYPGSWSEWCSDSTRPIEK